MLNLAPKISDILNNGTLDVLVYSGDKDFICNWEGGHAWTNGCKWAGQNDFVNKTYEDWTFDKDKTAAGQLKSFMNLKFLRVYEAGHMVPMNQPEAALNMLNQFISGGVHTKTPTKEEEEPRLPLQW